MQTNVTRPPSHLYKYLSLNPENEIHIEAIFIKNQLYFKSPEQFNDPFDCTVTINCDGSPDEYRNKLDIIYRHLEPELNESQRKRKIETFISQNEYVEYSEMVFQQRAENVGILCLTEEKDNIPMWSYYANSHSGFCLEFTTDFHFFKKIKAVRYRDDYPIVYFVRSSDEEMDDALFLTKSSAWQHEKEWRLVDMVQPSRLLDFPKEMLTGVIFGCQMDNIYKGKIIKWIKEGELSTKLFQAKKSNNKFSLDIIPL
jgi:hypothetical protein